MGDVKQLWRVASVSYSICPSVHRSLWRWTRKAYLAHWTPSNWSCRCAEHVRRHDANTPPVNKCFGMMKRRWCKINRNKWVNSDRSSSHVSGWCTACKGKVHRQYRYITLQSNLSTATVEKFDCETQNKNVFVHVILIKMLRSLEVLCEFIVYMTSDFNQRPNYMRASTALNKLHRSTFVTVFYVSTSRLKQMPHQHHTKNKTKGCSSFTPVWSAALNVTVALMKTYVRFDMRKAEASSPLFPIPSFHSAALIQLFYGVPGLEYRNQ